jgi:hypothetical protein
VELADRVRRTRLLLETMNDPLPAPRSALRSDPGPAASRYVPCETCKRSGWIRRKRKLALLCLACDGRGWRPRRSGEPEWDAYLGLPVQEAVQLPVEAAHRPRDPPEGEEPAYGWERLRASYERRGSYRELRVRLAELPARRRHLVVVVLVDGEPRQLDEQDRLQVELGVVQIALRMRSLRVPPWLLEHEQQTVNDTVKALANAGYTPAQIAQQTGLPKETVKQKLRRQRQGLTGGGLHASGLT